MIDAWRKVKLRLLFTLFVGAVVSQRQQQVSIQFNSLLLQVLIITINRKGKHF